MVKRSPLTEGKRDTRPCPVCAATQVARVQTIAGKLDCFAAPLRLATCAACGARYQPVVPTTAELAAWYDYMGAIADVATLTHLRKRRLARMLRDLEPFRRTGRLLELGCGGGLLLEVARGQGWDVHATELSESCCDRLRPQLQHKLHQGEVLSAPFAEQAFDAVVMIEVVEHLVDPLADLTRVARLLRPGGALFLTTPNIGGASYLLRGGGWRSIADEHLNYFDASTMTRLLQRVGFRNMFHRTSFLDLPSLLRKPNPIAREPEAGPAKKQAAAGPSKAFVADLLIEAGNVVVGASKRGDTLRTLAVR